MPCSYVNPHATKRALYLSTDPSALVLILYIHLQLTGRTPGGNGTSSHVLVLRKASSSSDIAFCHFGYFAASVYDFGSCREWIVETKAENDREYEELAESQ